MPASDRISQEASLATGPPPPHAQELRRELLQLARFLEGELLEDSAAHVAAWLDTHWPWEIAGSFEPGGYRWLVTGRLGMARVFILVCETTDQRSGSVDVVVAGGDGILPNWPRPPKLPCSDVTISTRALPHGVHFWTHLNASDLDSDHVISLVSLGAAALKEAAQGTRKQLGLKVSRARICARCSAVSASRVCPICNAELCFRVAWGALRRPEWQQRLVPALLMTFPLWAYGGAKAIAFVGQAPFGASMIAVSFAGFFVVLGLSLYLEHARPRRSHAGGQRDAAKRGTR